MRSFIKTATLAKYYYRHKVQKDETDGANERCKYVLIGKAENRHWFRLKANNNVYLKESECVDWSQVGRWQALVDIVITIRVPIEAVTKWAIISVSPWSHWIATFAADGRLIDHTGPREAWSVTNQRQKVWRLSDTAVCMGSPVMKETRSLPCWLISLRYMKSWEGMKKLFYNTAAPVLASGRDIAPITLREGYQGLARLGKGVSSPCSRSETWREQLLLRSEWR